MSHTAIFFGDGAATTMRIAVCNWCGCIHQSTCPRIRAIEYHPNGTVKRVEFWPTKNEFGQRST